MIENKRSGLKMNNEIQQPVFTTKYRRKPWIALTLSIISPGLGHVYNGLLGKAILYKLCMYIFFINPVII
jgi:hypothetical protein